MQQLCFFSTIAYFPSVLYLSCFVSFRSFFFRYARAYVRTGSYAPVFQTKICDKDVFILLVTQATRKKSEFSQRESNL